MTKIERLRLFDRNKSGFSIANFDMTPSLALTDISNGVPREVDIEASAQIGSRIYWLASHSNSSTARLARIGRDYSPPTSPMPVLLRHSLTSGVTIV